MTTYKATCRDENGKKIMNNRLKRFGVVESDREDNFITGK